MQYLVQGLQWRRTGLGDLIAVRDEKRVAFGESFFRRRYIFPELGMGLTERYQP